MDYPEYERQEELAHQGDHVAEYMKEIMNEWGVTHPTLAGLQRRVYKDTAAGISVSFQLDDGSFIWVGASEADDESLVSRVHRIGFSSIVEGSDCEVALRWLDLLDEQWDTPEKVIGEFERLVQETNDEACRLWDEEHDEDEPNCSEDD